jgi:hypothetical protein
MPIAVVCNTTVFDTWSCSPSGQMMACVYDDSHLHNVFFWQQPVFPVRPKLFIYPSLSNTFSQLPTLSAMTSE